MAFKTNKIIHGNALSVLKTFPKESVNLIVTSPPYFNLRNYEVGENALGNETDPFLYVSNVVKHMKAVHRVLKDDGSLILVIGDKKMSPPILERALPQPYTRA